MFSGCRRCTNGLAKSRVLAVQRRSVLRSDTIGSGALRVFTAECTVALATWIAGALLISGQVFTEQGAALLKITWETPYVCVCYGLKTHKSSQTQNANGCNSTYLTIRKLWLAITFFFVHCTKEKKSSGAGTWLELTHSCRVNISKTRWKVSHCGSQRHGAVFGGPDFK